MKKRSRPRFVYLKGFEVGVLVWRSLY